MKTEVSFILFYKMYSAFIILISRFRFFRWMTDKNDIQRNLLFGRLSSMRVQDACGKAYRQDHAHDYQQQNRFFVIMIPPDKRISRLQLLPDSGLQQRFDAGFYVCHIGSWLKPG